jgi:regulator of cell morphogenesis and NO signaling
MQHNEYVKALEAWNLEDIVEHVENTHHAYLKANFPLIHRLIDKLRIAYPEKTEYHEIHELFTEFTDDLARHLIKEEEILFPYFKQLGKSARDHSKVEPAIFGKLRKPIEIMENEHDSSHDIIDKIREITNNFIAKPEDDPVVHSLYFKFKEFDNDMHVHHEIENGLLFAKAQEIEEKLGL